MSRHSASLERIIKVFMNVTVVTVTLFFLRLPPLGKKQQQQKTTQKPKTYYIQKKLTKSEAMHSKNYLNIRTTAINFNFPLSRGEGFPCLATGVCAVLLKYSSHFASYSLYGGDSYFYFRSGF